MYRQRRGVKSSNIHIYMLAQKIYETPVFVVIFNPDVHRTVFATCHFIPSCCLMMMLDFPTCSINYKSVEDAPH
jgi:hypothetical protein